MRRRLPRAFYARPTLDVLADLIGKVLVHDAPTGRAAGVIVEAEAYIGESDPACHAAPGPTARNLPLYGPPGYAYVYLNYGIHYLVNAVTEPAGSPAAVLIRALEPIDGIDLMRARRLAVRRPMAGRVTARIEDADLCRGPGNLTVALAIGAAENRGDLVRGSLRIEDWGVQPAGRTYSRRIGIRVGTEPLWRCHWTGHAAVSGKRTDAVRAVSGSAAARRRGLRSARSGRSA